MSRLSFKVSLVVEDVQYASAGQSTMFKPVNKISRNLVSVRVLKGWEGVHFSLIFSWEKMTKADPQSIHLNKNILISLVFYWMLQHRILVMMHQLLIGLALWSAWEYKLIFALVIRTEEYHDSATPSLTEDWGKGRMTNKKMKSQAGVNSVGNILTTFLLLVECWI